MEPKRVQWIDAVKGVGILLVIAAHISPIGGAWFWYLTYGFMPIFFMMAGFTSKPNKDFYGSIRRKAERLLIPYFVYGLIIALLSSLIFDSTNLLQALCGLVYGRYSLYPENPINVVPLLKGCPDICPLWFLPCMFLAYLLLIIYDTWGGKIIMFLSSVVISILSIYKLILFPWSLDTCFMAFLFILVGRYFKKHIGMTRKNKDILYACLFFFVYVLLCKLNPNVNFSIGRYGNFVPWSVFLFFALGVAEPLSLSYLFRFFDKTRILFLLSYFGRHSLRLMCIHVFLAHLVGLFVGGHYSGLLISWCLIISVDVMFEFVFDKYKVKYSLLKYL